MGSKIFLISNMYVLAILNTDTKYILNNNHCYSIMVATN